MSQFTAGSLFSGVGMFDLAFAVAGFNILFQVELDGFCQKVLAKHAPTYWPDAQIHSDVCNVGRDTLPYVDVLFGGFPCTDISVAGKGEGIHVGTRSGLWFEFKRIIGEIRPRFVLLENVAAITRNGGTIVISDLAEMGYDCKWGIISAADAGAPHLRERWFCIAMGHPDRIRRNDSTPCEGRDSDKERHSSQGKQGRLNEFSPLVINGQVEHAARYRPQQQHARALSTGARQSYWRLDTAYVEHPHLERCEECDTPSGDRQPRYIGGGLSTLDVDNSYNQRCKEINPSIVRESSVSPWLDALNGIEARRTADQSRMGGSLDGLATRVDGHRLMSHVFPVGPNMPQPETEAPRMAPGNKNTNNRLKALGNGGLPQIVYPIALEIRALLEGQS